MRKRIKHILLLSCFPFLLPAQENIDSIIVNLGYQLDLSFSEGRIDYFLEKFDADYFYDEFVIENGNRGLALFNRNLKKENLPQELIETILSLSRNGYYDFINYWEDLRGYYLLFRYYDEEQGINYHKYFIYENDEGEYKIGDIFIFVNGEYFKEINNRLYTMRTAGKYGLPENKELKAGLSLIRMALGLAEKKQFEDAKAVFASIPAALKEEFFFMKVELQLIQNVEELDDWMQRFKTAHPDNPFCYLNSLDYYYEFEKYDKCIAVIDSLNQFVDDDLLELFKANTYLLAGETETAIDFYKKVTKNYPDFAIGYYQLLSAYVILGKYDDAVVILTKYKEDFSFTKKEIKGYVQTEFSSFYQSEAFNTWLKEN